MITAQIATLPERVDNLEKTVASLIDQVDQLFVALTGHKEVPSFLENNRKIIFIVMDNKLGDGAKFYDSDTREGYILTCDDDLVYPQGYARYMVEGIKKHGGIVTMLGKQYDTRPIASYGGGYTRIFNCLNSVRMDAEVDVGGTGVMGWHSDTIKIDPFSFPRKNMADIWVAKLAYEQGVPITVLAHPKGYFAHKTYPWRIWVKDRDNKYQTEIMNSFLKPALT